MVHKENGVYKSFGDMFIKIDENKKVIENERFLDLSNKDNFKINYFLNTYLYEAVSECESEKEHSEKWDSEKLALVQSYGDTALRGYAPFVDFDMPLEHIERIDELNIYNSDLEASDQARRDGLKFLNITIDEEPYSYYNGTILDTEENRRMIDSMTLDFKVRYN